MKTVLLIGLLLLGALVFAKQHELTQGEEINIGFYTVSVVDDANRARCYVVTSSVPRRDGPAAAISCVKN